MKFISPLDRRARKEFSNFFVDMIIGHQNVSFGSSSEILQILFVAMIHDLLKRWIWFILKFYEVRTLVIVKTLSFLFLPEIDNII